MSEVYCSRQEVGARVGDLRKRAQLGQGKLAQLLAVDQSTVSRIEQGDRSLSVGELTLLAGFFGVEPLSLLVKEESGLVALRQSCASRESVAAAIDALQSVVRDYFGAEALVS